MTEDDDYELVSMGTLLSALEETIAAAPEEKRAALADEIDKYAETFPEDFRWATGAQAPALTYNLLKSIYVAAAPVPDPNRQRFNEIMSKLRAR